MRDICKDRYFHIYPGHGPTTNITPISIDTGIDALSTVLEEGLLDFTEKDCAESWMCRHDVALKIHNDKFWVEWDPFLGAAVVQSGNFTFSKLASNHEH